MRKSREEKAQPIGSFHAILEAMQGETGWRQEELELSKQAEMQAP